MNNIECNQDVIKDAEGQSLLNAGLCVTYGENAPYCTLPAKRVFATVNGEKLFTWCTKILMYNGHGFVDARY